MSKKVTIYSGESMKDTLEQMKRIANKIEEKEEMSIMRTFWNILYKKPFIGKPKKRK